MDALHELELLIILFLQSMGEWLASPMRSISMLGNEEFYMLIMPSLYWCFDSIIGIRVAMMLLLSNSFGSVFKLAMFQPRPYWISTDVKAWSAETSFGIPSGHAFHAAAIWGMLAANLRSRWGKILMIVVIFLIGFSRIYLGMHFISDVLLGWLLGALLVLGYLKLEKPIVARLRTRSLTALLLLALVSSLIIIVFILLASAAQSGRTVPELWRQNALAGAPGNEIDPLSIEGAFTLAGTWFGMLAGAAWYFHRTGGLFNAGGLPSHRLLRYIVGLIGVFVLWFGLGQILPREADAVSYALRFVRYTLVGLWVSALAPILFERLGIASAPEAKEPALAVS